MLPLPTFHTSHTLRKSKVSKSIGARKRKVTLGLGGVTDVLHPESKQQTTPAELRDALECVAALARTRECRQDCVRFAYRGPQVDRLHVLELKRDVE